MTLRFQSIQKLPRMLLSWYCLPILMGLAGFSYWAAGADTGRQLLVGPKKKYQTLTAVAKDVRPGDTVLIDPGVYREAVIWRGGDVNGPPITVKGAGPEPTVIDGTGVAIHGNPRALFQVEGHNYIFEDLEIRNARNGHNGSGFRMLNSRKTTIRRCKITGCDMGMMSTRNDELLVEYSEIAYNGTPEYNGFAHNLYLYGNRTIIRYCYIHDATSGENVKSNSRYTELLYNYIADAHDRIEGGEPTKEIGLQLAEDKTTAPNSHAVLIGNLIIKKGNGYGFIDFGPEGKTPGRTGTLFMINNTVVREGTGDRWVLRMDHTDESAVLYNNIFYGGKLFARGVAADHLTGSNNWFPDGAEVAGDLKNTFRGKDPGFVDAGSRDYRLKPDSSLVNQGAEGISYLNAEGQSVPGAAREQYSAHKSRVNRPNNGRIDVGAFEVSSGELGAVALPGLSGRLTDNTGKPFNNVLVAVTGAVSTAVHTKEDGSYRVRNLPPGEYTVTPWVNKFPFSPASRKVSQTTAPSRADFTAGPLASIRGSIGTRSGKPVLPEIAVYLEGPASGWYFTTESGTFEFNQLPYGTYQVEAVKTVLKFTPPSHSVNLTADTAVEFKTEGRYIIFGTVTDSAGKPIKGMKLVLEGSGENRTTVANERGNYSFSGVPEGGNYTVTPADKSMSFTPPQWTFKDLSGNQREAMFRAR